MERRHPGRLTAAQNRLVMARQVADHKAFLFNRFMPGSPLRGEDALEGFAVNDIARGRDADIALGLHPALQRHAGVVFPQMLLTLHALNGLILFLPDSGDVQ